MLKSKKRSISFEVKNYIDLLILGILFALISVGLALAVTSNYGSDNDTYGMIHTFINLLEGNGYTPSRFTGYPVAEVGIGFIAYFFGSWLNNLVSFLFFIFSLVLIYSTLKNNHLDKKFFTFLILAISNPVLFFDNLAPMDYSWSLLFFSLGLFFLKKENLLFSALFFGVSVGTRPNYLFFAIVSILLFKPEKKLTNYQKFSVICLTAFIGSLFYLPIWFNSGLGFEWLTAGRPLGQGYEGLLARFAYKSWMAVGLLAFPFIIYFLIKSWNRIKKIDQFNLIFGLITINLLIYLYIPADRSYLQLSLVLLFLLIANLTINQAFIIFVTNIVSWFVLINPFLFTFKSNDPCGNLEAIGVKFNPNISKGELFIYLDNQSESNCYVDRFQGLEIELNKGSKLKK